MQWTTIETNWTAYVPRIMTRWPELDEDELLSTDGRMSDVVSHMADRQAIDSMTARDRLRDWMMGSEPSDAIMDESRDNARIMDAAKDIPAGEDVYSDDQMFGDDNVADTPMGRR